MVWADTDCLSGFDDQFGIWTVGTGWLGFVHKGSVQNGFHAGFGLRIFIREILKCKYEPFIQINTGIQIIGDQFIRCGIPAVTIKGCPGIGFDVVTDRRGTPVVAWITAGSLNQIFDLTGFVSFIIYKIILVDSCLDSFKSPGWMSLMQFPELCLIAFRKSLIIHIGFKIFVGFFP